MGYLSLGANGFLKILGIFTYTEDGLDKSDCDDHHMTSQPMPSLGTSSSKSFRHSKVVNQSF